MLQNTRSQTNGSLHVPSEDMEQGFDLGRSFDILKRRLLYLVIPFILVSAIGSAIVILLPPIYRSEGKILVESQQIPIDLVRPTVTATAKERISVIEQRVMTRENLLSIADKFRIFPNRQELSDTEVLDDMRKAAQIEPVELRSDRDHMTIAVSVSFEHRRPEIATQVANELLTLVLKEDARNRTTRAAETTKFLNREVQRLQAQVAKLDARILELRLSHQKSDEQPSANQASQTLSHLAVLKAELQGKLSIFSDRHPEVIRLKRQIASLEKSITKAPAFKAGTNEPIIPGMEILENQRDTIQKNLDGAMQKLAAARLGESLERDQFSERLQVLEQAVTPQRPVKPNRRKLLLLVFGVAGLAGFAGIFAAESIDKTIHSRHELLSLVDSRMIVAIPYITTQAEKRLRRARLACMVGAFAVVITGTLLALNFLVRPLDEIWASVLARLMA